MVNKPSRGNPPEDFGKTLTDEEINQTVNKILKDLKYKLGAVLR